MRDFLNGRLRDLRNDGVEGSDDAFGDRNLDDQRFSRLSAAAACHACRCASTIVLRGLPSTAAWLADYQRGGARSAEAQDGDNHGDEKAAHGVDSSIRLLWTSERPKVPDLVESTLFSAAHSARNEGPA